MEPVRASYGPRTPDRGLLRAGPHSNSSPSHDVNFAQGRTWAPFERPRPARATTDHQGRTQSQTTQPQAPFNMHQSQIDEEAYRRASTGTFANSSGSKSAVDQRSASYSQDWRGTHQQHTSAAISHRPVLDAISQANRATVSLPSLASFGQQIRVEAPDHADSTLPPRCHGCVHLESLISGLSTVAGDLGDRLVQYQSLDPSVMNAEMFRRGKTMSTSDSVISIIYLLKAYGDAIGRRNSALSAQSEPLAFGAGYRARSRSSLTDPLQRPTRLLPCDPTDDLERPRKRLRSHSPLRDQLVLDAMSAEGMSDCDSVRRRSSSKTNDDENCRRRSSSRSNEEVITVRRTSDHVNDDVRYPEQYTERFSHGPRWRHDSQQECKFPSPPPSFSSPSHRAFPSPGSLAANTGPFRPTSSGTITLPPLNGPWGDRSKALAGPAPSSTWPNPPTSSHNVSTTSASSSHTAELQRQVTLRTLSLQTLQSEYSSLLQKLHREKIRTETISRKSSVAEEEIGTLTARNEELAEATKELQSQLDVAERKLSEERQSWTRDRTQWMKMMENGAKIQQKHYELKTSWAEERARLLDTIAQSHTVETPVTDISTRDTPIDDVMGAAKNKAWPEASSAELVALRNKVGALSDYVGILRTALDQAKQSNTDMRQQFQAVLDSSETASKLVEDALITPVSYNGASAFSSPP